MAKNKFPEFEDASHFDMPNGIELDLLMMDLQVLQALLDVTDFRASMPVAKENQERHTAYCDWRRRQILNRVQEVVNGK